MPETGKKKKKRHHYVRAVTELTRSICAYMADLIIVIIIQRRTYSVVCAAADVKNLPFQMKISFMGSGHDTGSLNKHGLADTSAPGMGCRKAYNCSKQKVYI